MYVYILRHTYCYVVALMTAPVIESCCGDDSPILTEWSFRDDSAILTESSFSDDLIKMGDNLKYIMLCSCIRLT